MYARTVPPAIARETTLELDQKRGRVMIRAPSPVEPPPMRLPALLALFVLSAACDQHKTKKADKPEATEPAFVPKGAKGVKPGGDDDEESDPKSLKKANLVADLGFRVTKEGFGFPNFTLHDDDNFRLGPKDLKKLCGEKAVCASGDDEEECTLKSGAQAFLDSAARLLRGGHCEGFSVGSLRMWSGEDDPSKYGGDTVFDLDRKAKTERYLAYWAITQMSPSVAHATYRAAPNKVLDKLIKSMKKKSETYVLGIHRADGKGGHAIVPYAVEDRGDDIYWVYVYENNSPGKLRHVEFDKSKNTWRYDDAATSPEDTPSIYSGKASAPRIELIPQSARENMECPFAAGSDDDDDDEPKPKKKKKKKIVEEEPEEPQIDEGNDGDDDVMLIGRGSASMSVQDEAGHTLGLKDGEFVSEIPGATYVIPRGKISSNMEPILFVPAKTKVKLTVRGTDGQKDDIAIIGKKFAANLSGVTVSSKPSEPIEINGKAKTVSLPPVAVAKIELFLDKGKSVQKIEAPLLKAGAMLKLDGKIGKLEIAESKGAVFKPIVAPLQPVVKPIPAPKLIDPVKPAPVGVKPLQPGASATGPVGVKPIEPVKPVQPGASATGLVGVKPIEPVKPIAPIGMKPIEPAKPTEPAKPPPPALIKPKLIGGK